MCHHSWLNANSNCVRLSEEPYMDWRVETPCGTAASKALAMNDLLQPLHGQRSACNWNVGVSKFNISPLKCVTSAYLYHSWGSCDKYLTGVTRGHLDGKKWTGGVAFPLHHVLRVNGTAYSTFRRAVTVVNNPTKIWYLLSHKSPQRRLLIVLVPQPLPLPC